MTTLTGNMFAQFPLTLTLSLRERKTVYDQLAKFQRGPVLRLADDNSPSPGGEGRGEGECKII
jgi:hypothetical protein